MLGGVRTFAELLEQPPRADEQGDGWDPGERTRFGRYARRMWDGLLSCEEADRPVSATRPVPPFDIGAPLPTGVTVLEASAGTGKTFTIAALAARYVAEGTPLKQLLLVTFTRMATGELRDRVRERLVSAEQGLSNVLAGAPAGAGDEVVRLLARGTREQVETRRARLALGLADFDSATIATTHGFCQEVLGGLGVAGDVQRDTAFVESIEDLLAEVVDDLYVRRFHARDIPDFDRAQALEIARARRRQRGGPDRAAGGARGQHRRRCAAGSRKRSARSSSGASAGSR